MFLKAFKALFLLMFSVSLGTVAWADQAAIEAVEGAKAVNVKRDGKTIQMKVGDALASGDEIVTDEKTAVDLRLEDESLVRVGVNSSYRIVEESGAAKFLHRLISGAVMVLVPKKTDAKGDEIKFRMRTPQGTIGVRGTEFTVNTTKEGTTLRGLSGEVMFGPVDADFPQAEKFVFVAKGFESSIGNATGSAPSKPKKFDLPDYLKEIKGRNGPFAGMAPRSNLKTVKRGEAPPPIVVAENKSMEKPSFGGNKAAKPAPAKPTAAPGVSLDARLLLLAANGSFDEVKDVLAKGANVNARDKQGNTAMHYAALNKELKIIQLLKSKGADVNARNAEGSTPLMVVAVDLGPVNNAKLLVQNNADPSLKNQDQRTAFEMARDANAKRKPNEKNDELVQYLDEVTE